MTTDHKRTPRLLGMIAAVVAAMMLGLTVLSLVDGNQGWIRVLDFPREIFFLLALTFAAASLALPRGWRAGIGLMFLIVAGLQFWRFHGYTPLAAKEVALTADPKAHCFTALSLNVLQKNRDHDRVAALIDRERPDILLLMETDETWAAALSPTLSRFPHLVAKPLDNTYGMIFASRLPVEQARMDMRFGRDTPSLYATLRTREGDRFELIGLHPRPPRPDQDTAARDRVIVNAGLETPDDLPHVVTLGDFNDVPWSATTRAFRALGNYLDPRVGRGTYATFPASHVWLGWPLDQLFVKRGFSVRSIDVLENVGSDHRPLRAELCIDPATARTG